MKNFLFILPILLLASCSSIQVSDFGTQWDKNAADPKLQGIWLDQDNAHSTERGDAVWEFVPMGAAHWAIIHIAEKGKKETFSPFQSKTLTSGPYKFLMLRQMGQKSGDLLRYTVSGDTLENYMLNLKNAGPWLRQKYPHAHNIKLEVCPKKRKQNNLFCTDHIQISTLDDEAINILAAIPNTAEFWMDASDFHKQYRFNN